MEPAVRTELDALLGYMRACRRVLEAVEAGHERAPTPPGGTGYMVAMTWAQASGALQVLEHLRLITTAERREWEDVAAEIVEPVHRRD
jgi:hypothetical protein